MGIMTSAMFDDAKPKPPDKAKEGRHHKEFSPSSFPAMDKCPCYRPPSGGSSEALVRGNDLHRQLQEILTAHDV